MKKKIEKIILSWIPEGKGSRRSRSLSEILGIEIIRFPLFTRKIFLSPVKFPVQTVVTLMWLFLKKPSILIVEFTQPIIGLVSLIYSQIFKKTLIIDMHSGPIISKKWAFLKPLTKVILKKANLVIIHEKTIKEKLYFLKKDKVFILPDPPLNIKKKVEPFKWEKNYLVFPSSGDTDEPIDELEKTSSFLKNTHIFVTGGKKKSHSYLKFTGFLPTEKFYSLLKGSKGILALTTWEYTILSACFEAISFEKPLIVSNKKALRKFFGEKVIYVENEANSIKEGIEKLLENYEEYSKKIKEFKKYYENMWLKKIKDFKRILTSFEKVF